MNRLELLLTKENIMSDEELELKDIQLKLDQIYVDMAKGAFIRSRAKRLEEGERNTNYFFAHEKRNIKRKSLSALNIDGAPSKDLKIISNFVTEFYRKLYNSNYNAKACEPFLEKIHTNIPSAEEDFKSICDSDLSATEIKNALFSVKKGKSPGTDGLSVEFYIHFWEFIQNPLLCMYVRCYISYSQT